MGAVVFTMEGCVYDVVRVASQDAPSFKDKTIQLIQSKGCDTIPSEHSGAPAKEGDPF